MKRKEISELFIPYKLAIKAKKKGFNEPCLAWYNDFPFRNINDPNKAELIIFGKDLLLDEYYKEKNNCLAPVYQQIIDWFREKHKIHIEVLFHDKGQYEVCIINENKTDWFGFETTSDILKSYYEALNKAIFKAFKLI